MLCLVILKTRTNGNYDKEGQKRLQDLPDQFSYEKLEEIGNGWKQKSKPIITTLNQQSFLQYSFKMKLKKPKGFQKTNPMFNLQSTMTCSWF